jgi:hypothetical protein
MIAYNTSVPRESSPEALAMPIHDWTLVDAGIFHDFHATWTVELKRALNAGLLPAEYYALAEQIAGGLGPDVLTLRAPKRAPAQVDTPGGGLALETAPPKVRLRVRGEVDLYASKAKAVVIRHRSTHEIIAMLEIVSPGNKSNRHGIRTFVDKAVAAVRAGIHLLIVDLFPPGPRDPQGLHKVICDELFPNDIALPADKQLALGAYIGVPGLEALIEPVAVHDPLPRMPLYLTPDGYVWTPLEATYQSAWEAVPSYWREVLTSSTAG